MSQKKEFLGISNKEYYDRLSRGLKVTRSVSKKNNEDPKLDDFEEFNSRDIAPQKHRRK